jgi:uncharacterized membrane protein YeaQ/YmgE (transglycosylase-associated protein family)
MSLFGIIGTAIVGLIVGVIAKWISPGKDPGGFFVTMAIGIAGAFVARFIGSAVFGWYRDGDAPGWVMSIAGAVLLLWLYRVIMRNRAA